MVTTSKRSPGVWHIQAMVRDMYTIMRTPTHMHLGEAVHCKLGGQLEPLLVALRANQLGQLVVGLEPAQLPAEVLVALQRGQALLGSQNVTHAAHNEHEEPTAVAVVAEQTSANLPKRSNENQIVREWQYAFRKHGD